ncbi:MAG: Gfo/Idh/MocA family oxidoreductase [Planctomycetes bacterium]|nr:Gfo/Idh/MocA family oxidoreductase [Planctomycetota bacterium]
MPRNRMSRRSFVRTAAVGVGGMALARTARSVRAAPGANERITIASIGVGGQGSAHLREMVKMEDIRVAAVCDVDQNRLDAAAKVVGEGVKATKDFREIIDDKTIDAVLIATPGHWHGIPAIRACRAGKHVYVEKPICHNIKEGRALVEAARENKSIVQVGTQQRTTKHWANAVNRIKAGELGRINMIHVWNAWNTREMFSTIGHAADSDPPPGVDYDLWLGPAPKRRFNRLRFHGTHYFFWEYGGGMMSEWAIHLFDVVAWAMGPQINSVSAAGGNHVWKDDRETPDTAVATFDCPGYTMTYSMRHGNGWHPHGDMDHGIEFFGTDMTLQVNRNYFAIFRDADRGTRKPHYIETGNTGLWDHKRNFFDCIRSGKQPEAHAEAGHLSSIIGHLANISYRVGRRLTWDAKSETTNDDDANKLLGRAEYRAPWHL